MRRARMVRRRGTIIPLSALMISFLLIMVAFAVDTSWMVLTKSELQNAADASALAGSAKLQTYYVQYATPGTTTAEKTTIRTNAIAAAQSTAKTYAGYNVAGGVSSLALADADIVVGYTSDAGAFTPAADDASKFPNTVRVTARRASGTNGSLSLFFGPIAGVKSVSLDATAEAAIYTGVVDEPNAAGVGMLPITYDVDFWDYFLKTGKDADGNTKEDTNGYGVLNLYSTGNYKGNFGLLSLDGSNANANANKNWVNNGPSAADIKALEDKKLIPLSSRLANAYDWEGTPGFEASTVMEVNSHIGKTFVVPLYKPYATDFSADTGPPTGTTGTTGNGNGNGKSGGTTTTSTTYTSGVGQGANYKYNIVRFVALKILDPTLYGGKTNRDIIVQPAPMTTEKFDMKASTTVPAGSSSNKNSFVFVTPKFTK